MNSNLFFETLYKNFNTWRKVFLNEHFWSIITFFGGLKTNSGVKMTISGGTFTISGAPQNRFPIK